MESKGPVSDPVVEEDGRSIRLLLDGLRVSWIVEKEVSSIEFLWRRCFSAAS